MAEDCTINGGESLNYTPYDPNAEAEASATEEEAYSSEGVAASEEGVCLDPATETADPAATENETPPPPPPQDSFCTDARDTAPDSMIQPRLGGVTALFSPQGPMSSPDTSQGQVAVEALEYDLAEIAAHIEAGDLDAADEAFQRFDEEYVAFSDAHPDLAAERQDIARDAQYYRAELALARGNLDEAYAFTDSALSLASRSLDHDSEDVTAYRMAARMSHRLGDYEAAAAYYREAAAIDPSQRCEEENYLSILRDLQGETEAMRSQAEGQHDAPTVVHLLSEELKLARALGDTDRVTETATALQSWSRQLGAETMLAQVEEVATTSELMPDHLGDNSRYVTFECDPEGRTHLSLTDEFYTLSPERQFTVLTAIQRSATLQQHRHLAEQAPDGAQRRYYEARVFMMEGDLLNGTLAYMDVNDMARESDDPELQVMRAEAREVLQAQTLQHIDQMLRSVDMINEDQNSQTIGWTIGNNIRADGMRTYLRRVRELVAEGRAVTVDEARAAHDRDYIPWFPPSENFGNIFNLWSRGTLERQTSGGDVREQHLLSIAQGLREEDGFQAAGILLQEIFEEPLQDAIGTISEGERARIEQEVREDFDDFQEGVLDELEEFAEDHPDQYRDRFGDGGPSNEEIAQMTELAIQGEVNRQLRRRGMEILDGRVERGEVDRTVARAWGVYEDMQDPLDRFWNLADSTKGLIIKEAVITAVTLPATLGVGTLVRTGIGGTSLALRLSAQGGWRYLAAQGIVLTGGAAAEGLVQEAQHSFLTNRNFNWGNVGFNIALSYAFHGGGQGWQRAAHRLGLDDAIENSRGLARVGYQTADFTGMMTTQTSLATASTYAAPLFTGHPNPETFWDRVAVSALQMVGYHYATQAVGRPTGLLNMEQQMWQRLQTARQGYRQGREVSTPVDEPEVAVNERPHRPDVEEVTVNERPRRPVSSSDEVTVNQRPRRPVSDETTSDEAATVERPVEPVNPQEFAAAHSLTPEQRQWTQFDANELVAYYRDHPDRMATLAELSSDTGRWGSEAQQFRGDLDRLTTAMDEYNQLGRQHAETGDPETLQAMDQLLSEEVIPLRARIEQSWYHRMDSAHNERVGQFETDLIGVEGALTSAMIEHRVVGDAGEFEFPVRYDMDVARPEALRRHIDNGFDLVRPEEFVDVRVTVATPEQADAVVARLREHGVQVAHNDDVVALETHALSGKEVAVILPSGEELTINIRVAPPLAEAVPSAHPVQPWMRSQIRAGDSLYVNGELVRVEAVGDGTVSYDASSRADTIDIRTVPLSDAILAENFTELPIAEIRPTENGLSRFRLETAGDYLAEPISVSRHRDPETGEVRYYATNGHHRLRAALEAGETTVRVRFGDYDESWLQWKFQDAASEGFPLPDSIEGLSTNPHRFDDYRGTGTPPEQHRQALEEAGLVAARLSDQQLAEANDWLALHRNSSGTLSDGDARTLARHLEGEGWNREAVVNLVGWDRARTIFHPPVPPWAETALREHTQAGMFIDGEWVTVTAVNGGEVTYTTVERVDGRAQRVTHTRGVDEALLAENFAQVPIDAIRPTENGLSEVRLESAAEHLDEPILVYHHTHEDGSVEYFALDGHHRLAALAERGDTEVRVRFADYDYESIQDKLAHPRNPALPVPEQARDLAIDPARQDNYLGEVEEMVAQLTGTDDGAPLAERGAEEGLRQFVERPTEDFISDRNQRENAQARAIVRDAQRILQQHGIDVDPHELQETYHAQVATVHKDGPVGRRNNGNLENYDTQLRELIGRYGVTPDLFSTSPDDAVNYVMRNDSSDGLTAIVAMDVGARNRLHEQALGELERLMGEASATSYEELPPPMRIEFEDVIWPRLRDGFIQDYWGGN